MIIKTTEATKLSALKDVIFGKGSSSELLDALFLAALTENNTEATDGKSQNRLLDPTCFSDKFKEFGHVPILIVANLKNNTNQMKKNRLPFQISST